MSFNLEPATDNVALSSVSLSKDGIRLASLNTNGTYELGSYMFTYMAVDTSGNVGLCSWVLTVRDIASLDFEPPQATCPQTSFTYLADAGKSTATVFWPSIEVTDNMKVASRLYVSSPSGYINGSAYPVGSTKITFIAKDGNGNFVSCVFTIIVEDHEVSTRGFSELRPLFNACGPIL